MTAERSVFLRHALDCIDFVADELAQVDGQQFLENRMLRDAVLRNLEVIGQACKDYGIAELELREQLPSLRRAIAEHLDLDP